MESEVESESNSSNCWCQSVKEAARIRLVWEVSSGGKAFSVQKEY